MTPGPEYGLTPEQQKRLDKATRFGVLFGVGKARMCIGCGAFILTDAKPSRCNECMEKLNASLRLIPVNVALNATIQDAPQVLAPTLYEMLHVPQSEWFKGYSAANPMRKFRL